MSHGAAVLLLSLLLLGLTAPSSGAAVAPGRVVFGLFAVSADGSILLTGSTFGTGLPVSLIHLARVATDGGVTGPTLVATPFGGGVASSRAADPKGLFAPLAQTSFRAISALLRPDGSVVLPGAVGVIRVTGSEGEGVRSEQAAVVSITPSSTLDGAFGGPGQSARLSVRVAMQKASAAVSPRFRRISILADASGPGLCDLEVVAGGRVLARSAAPVFVRGRQRLPALLTAQGRRYLRHRHGVPVRVSARFRDLLASTTTARATGRLR